VFALLVDDLIDGDRGLASLPVADNKLTLATPDRHHCIDGFQSCLQWLLHRLSVDYTRRDPFNWVVLFGDDWTSIVNRVAEHVDHAANHRLADRHHHDAARSFHEIAFADRLKLAKQHRAHFVFFKIQSQTANVVRKLEQLAGHDFFEAVEFGDAVADLDDRSDFGN